MSASALTPRFITLRKARIEARERFLAGRRAEKQYRIALNGVAKNVGDIIRGMAPQGIVSDISALTSMLNRYADILRPWAESVAARMIADVSRRDAAAWQAHGREIGRALRREIESAPTGVAMREALSRQVSLITSLPAEAAQRVHKLTIEAMIGGQRASSISQEILRSGNVTRSRAMTIARTEVSRTASELTIARAQHVGATHYVWETSRDGAVRPSHRAMQGKVVPFDTPVDLDGMTGHAGEFPNCRCFVRPILNNLK